MRIAVKDASILIDLAEGDMLGLWFQLRIETHTTDLVLREVRREAQWQRVSTFLDAGLLTSHRAEGAKVLSAAVFANANRISLADASGVLLARELGAMLLTGDRRMRLSADAEEIETHGLLWIMDLLVARNVLVGADAATRLERILAAGSRLPKAECVARLRKWRGSSA
ncbi:hypothetical protein [Actomonas aquatica]|uniref:PIN domain-containing protein n=1 Tax=Actomonas aquatica TaxID=2866162 RepID=A0ABZ1C5I9_9BACT|nr:hypothetical protein [Opitutus sp. WL0086]WRQ85560.1 hypothetical protein K1X11_012175 [Opitutus sp. WL0086]